MAIIHSKNESVKVEFLGKEETNIEDVWRQVFSAWIEFDDLDMVSEYNWSFSNLEDAFKEGGVLYEKQVYLFMCLERKVILEAAILTDVVVVSLTLFTFWGAYKDYDFSFLGPFLSAALTVLVVSTLLQIFYPLGKIQAMIYGCIGSLIFCGYIVYDTYNLIEVYAYDEYILGAIALYLDILNLFLHLLRILIEADDS